MGQLENVLRDLQQQTGFLQQRVRELQGVGARLDGQFRQHDQALANLQSSLGSIDSSSSGGNGDLPTPEQVGEHSIRYIERIPGRRIPFDFLVDIIIGANVTTVQPGTRTVSQDGPFVAVGRYATFQSALQFAVRDPETGALATFNGRSFGRLRPIHSVTDYNDASFPFQPVTPMAFPGTGAPIYASPTNHSGFRTMEMDAFIEFINQGSGYPRGNQEVPSSFWASETNTLFQLGALDFFERGETLQWKIRPTHVNNPPAGNVSGFAAGGVYPFLDSQYDVHEGISDPLNRTVTQDPVTRLPQGIVTLGFHGMRIIQPPGPVRMT